MDLIANFSLFSTIAKDLSLEEIDLLWANDEIKQARGDLRVVPQVIPDIKEAISDAKSKEYVESKV